ncbi:MAG: hypothetical protein ACYDEP_02490 [Acidimicrobiales bacterium]
MKLIVMELICIKHCDGLLVELGDKRVSGVGSLITVVEHNCDVAVGGVDISLHGIEGHDADTVVAIGATQYEK